MRRSLSSGKKRIFVKTSVYDSDMNDGRLRNPWYSRHRRLLIYRKRRAADDSSGGGHVTAMRREWRGVRDSKRVETSYKYTAFVNEIQNRM